MSMKGKEFTVRRDLDMRGTGGPGGPLIPKGTRGKVEKVRRTGELWVDVEGFGRRRLAPGDVRAVQ